MTKKKPKTSTLPRLTPIADGVVRIPGYYMELLRLAMMHDPGSRGRSMKSVIGILCANYAEGVIAERGVTIPAHLIDCKTTGGAR